MLELANLVRPTAFSLEHISKAMSPTGKIDSAPKEFSVWVSVCEDSFSVIFIKINILV